MHSRQVETMLSLVAIFVALAFVIQVALLDHKSRLRGYPLRAVISDVGLLKVGSTIRLGGVTVGEIRNIGLDKKRYVGVLDLVVRDDLAIPVDSSLRMTTLSLLGQPYLELALGSSKEVIPVHGEILQVRGAVSLTDIIGRALFGTIE